MKGPGVIAVLVLVAGCAVPKTQIAASNEAVRAAVAAGAESEPQARAFLAAAAQEQLDAQWQMDVGSNRVAEGLLLRAQGDAELALALARELPERRAAEQALARVRALRERM